MSKSIMQVKNGTCYLCNQEGNPVKHVYLEEHHCFGGSRRKLSEHYGLKGYLCPRHHRIGEKAVHMNKELRQQVQRDAQIAFEIHHPDKSFRAVFGKNYIYDDEETKPA